MHRWYDRQPRLLGANYARATAINQMEMWQAETFDPVTIDKELGWAEQLHMNTMRAFQDDMLWEQDLAGFKKRIATFLTIAAKYQIRPVFVLFDSCWDPNRSSVRSIDQSPASNTGGYRARARRADTAHYGKLRSYVEEIVGIFANDKRILAWDVWNDSNNGGGGGGSCPETPNKTALVPGLLGQVFDWAQAKNPIQLLTSGVWTGDHWDRPTRWMRSRRSSSRVRT